MMVDVTTLLEDARRLARGLPLEDRTKDFESLMTFEASAQEPIHRWFRFKEGFSAQLVFLMLEEHFQPTGSTVSLLDPFCGVGTSLLAAEPALARAGTKTLVLRGVEVNPYLRFVAATKLMWNRYDPLVMSKIAATSLNGVRLPARPVVPALSTFRNSKFIERNTLLEVLALRDKVRIVGDGRPEEQPLLLGLAATADTIFNLRKDGRALRYTPRDEPVAVYAEAYRRWAAMITDLHAGNLRGPTDYAVVEGDGRRADALFPPASFDIILFSPPYLNNIDYTEVYKLELWLLNFLESRESMLAQRRRTFRSHPSCTFPDLPDAASENAAILLGRPFRRLLDYAGQRNLWRKRLFGEYFADILRTLQSSSALLRPHGRIFVVIGNSLHGTSDYPIPVAADLWASRLAEAVGLHVERVMIGRYLARRKLAADLLRESIIVLSKR